MILSAHSTISLGGRKQFAFWIEIAGGQVIVHKAGGLHERIDDGSANETEAALAQIFAEGVGFGSRRGELL